MSKAKALDLKIESFYRRTEAGSHNGVSPLGRRISIQLSALINMRGKRTHFDSYTKQMNSLSELGVETLLGTDILTVCKASK